MEGRRVPEVKERVPHGKASQRHVKGSPTNQLPGTPTNRPPQTLSEPELRLGGHSENCLRPGPLRGVPANLGGPPEKSYKSGSPRGAPKPEGSRENPAGTAAKLGSQGARWSVLGAPPRGPASHPRLPAPGPQIPARSELAGVGGDKGGAGGRAGGAGAAGSGGSPHGCSAGGRRTHRTGRPWIEVQGFRAGSGCCSVSPGVPPHRVRLPGENVDGAGAGPRAPPRSGGSDRGPRGRKGCGVPPRRPAAPAAVLLSLPYFPPLRIPPLPTVPRALKGPRRRRRAGRRALERRRRALTPRRCGAGLHAGSLSHEGEAGGGEGIPALPTMGILRGISTGHKELSPFPPASPFLCSLPARGRGQGGPSRFLP